MSTIIKTTSHRSRGRVEYALGRKPQSYYSWKVEGNFLKLDDPVEIEKVLKLKGVSKARNQQEDAYHKCHGSETSVSSTWDRMVAPTECACVSAQNSLT